MSRTQRTWLERSGFLVAITAVVGMLTYALLGRERPGQAEWSLAGDAAAGVAEAAAPLGADVATRERVDPPPAGDTIAEPQTPRGATVLGRVVDAAGNGRADIAVLYGPVGRWDPLGDPAAIPLFATQLERLAKRSGEFHAGRICRTDAAGHFACDRGATAALGLIAYHPEIGYAHTSLTASDVAPVTLVLAQQPRVIGHVHDALGRPVANMTVQLYAPGRAMPVTQARSREDGRFTSPRLAPGTYQASVHGPSHRGSKPVELQLAAHGGDHTLDVAVVALPALDCMACDPTGAPWTIARLTDLGVEAARVQWFLSLAKPTTRSDLDREPVQLTRLTWDAATSRLTGIAQDERCRHLSAWVDQRLVGAAELRELTQRTVTTQWQSLEHTRVVRIGVTVTPTPAAIPNVVALALDAEDPTKTLATTSGDVAELRLHLPLTPRARIHVTAPGYERAEFTVEAASAGETLERAVELRQLDGVISGSLVDSAGRPVPNATVALLEPSTTPGQAPWSRVGSDADGSFHCKGLPQRPLRMLTRADGVGSAALTLQPTTEATRPVILLPQRTVTVLGATAGLVVRCFDARGDLVDDDSAFGVTRYGTELTFGVHPDTTHVELRSTERRSLGRYALEGGPIRLPAAK